MKPTWIEFTAHADRRGTLVAVEGGRDVPFEIRRVYSMFAMPAGAMRGAHAHRRQRQVIVCLAGNCLLRLDDGCERLELRLDRPSRGLMLEPRVWHELGDFSPDCVLLVLADGLYESGDVVADRGEFLRLVGVDPEGARA